MKNLIKILSFTICSIFSMQAAVSTITVDANNVRFTQDGTTQTVSKPVAFQQGIILETTPSGAYTSKLEAYRAGAQAAEQAAKQAAEEAANASWWTRLLNYGRVQTLEQTADQAEQAVQKLEQQTTAQQQEVSEEEPAERPVAGTTTAAERIALQSLSSDEKNKRIQKMRDDYQRLKSEINELEKQANSAAQKAGTPEAQAAAREVQQINKAAALNKAQAQEYAKRGNLPEAQKAVDRLSANLENAKKAAQRAEAPPTSKALTPADEATQARQRIQAAIDDARVVARQTAKEQVDKGIKDRGIIRENVNQAVRKKLAAEQYKGVTFDPYQIIDEEINAVLEEKPQVPKPAAEAPTPQLEKPLVSEKPTVVESPETTAAADKGKEKVPTQAQKLQEGQVYVSKDGTTIYRNEDGQIRKYTREDALYRGFIDAQAKPDRVILAPEVNKNIALHDIRQKVRETLKTSPENLPKIIREEPLKSINIELGIDPGEILGIITEEQEAFEQQVRSARAQETKAPAPSIAPETETQISDLDEKLKKAQDEYGKLDDKGKKTLQGRKLQRNIKLLEDELQGLKREQEFVKERNAKIALQEKVRNLFKDAPSLFLDTPQGQQQLVANVESDASKFNNEQKLGLKPETIRDIVDKELQEALAAKAPTETPSQRGSVIFVEKTESPSPRGSVIYGEESRPGSVVYGQEIPEPTAVVTEQPVTPKPQEIEPQIKQPKRATLEKTFEVDKPLQNLNRKLIDITKKIEGQQATIKDKAKQPKTRAEVQAQEKVLQNLQKEKAELEKTIATRKNLLQTGFDLQLQPDEIFISKDGKIVYRNEGGLTKIYSITEAQNSGIVDSAVPANTRLTEGEVSVSKDGKIVLQNKDGKIKAYTLNEALEKNVIDRRVPNNTKLKANEAFVSKDGSTVVHNENGQIKAYTREDAINKGIIDRTAKSNTLVPAQQTLAQQSEQLKNEFNKSRDQLITESQKASSRYRETTKENQTKLGNVILQLKKENELANKLELDASQKVAKIKQLLNEGKIDEARSLFNELQQDVEKIRKAADSAQKYAKVVDDIIAKPTEGPKKTVGQVVETPKLPDKAKDLKVNDIYVAKDGRVFRNENGTIKIYTRKEAIDGEIFTGSLAPDTKLAQEEVFIDSDGMVWRNEKGQIKTYSFDAAVNNRIVHPDTPRNNIYKNADEALIEGRDIENEKSKAIEAPKLLGEINEAARKEYVNKIKSQSDELMKKQQAQLEKSVDDAIKKYLGTISDTDQPLLDKVARDAVKENLDNITKQAAADIVQDLIKQGLQENQAKIVAEALAKQAALELAENPTKIMDDIANKVANSNNFYLMADRNVRRAQDEIRQLESSIQKAQGEEKKRLQAKLAEKELDYQEALKQKSVNEKIAAGEAKKRADQIKIEQAKGPAEQDIRAAVKREINKGLEEKKPSTEIEKNARAAANEKNKQYTNLKLDVNKIVDEELAKSDQFKKLRGQEEALKSQALQAAEQDIRAETQREINKGLKEKKPSADIEKGAHAAADEKNEKYADLKLDVNKIVDEELAKSDQFKKLRGQELSDDLRKLKLEFTDQEARAKNAAKNASTQADKIPKDDPIKAEGANKANQLAQQAADQAKQAEQANVSAAKKQLEIQRLIKEGKIFEAQNEFNELQNELIKVKQAADDAEARVEEIQTIQQTKPTQPLAEYQQAKKEVQEAQKKLEDAQKRKDVKPQELEQLKNDLAQKEELAKKKQEQLNKAVEERLEKAIKNLELEKTKLEEQIKRTPPGEAKQALEAELAQTEASLVGHKQALLSEKFSVVKNEVREAIKKAMAESADLPYEQYEKALRDAAEKAKQELAAKYPQDKDKLMLQADKIATEEIQKNPRYRAREYRLKIVNEIETPLKEIDTITEQVKKGEITPEEAAQRVNKIKEAATKRAGELAEEGKKLADEIEGTSKETEIRKVSNELVNAVQDSIKIKSEQFEKVVVSTAQKTREQISKDLNELKLQFTDQETRANNAAKNAATQADKIATDQPEKAERANKANQLAQEAADQAKQANESAAKKQSEIQRLIKEGNILEAQNKFSELQKELATIRQAADDAEAGVKQIETIQKTPVEELEEALKSQALQAAEQDIRAETQREINKGLKEKKPSADIEEGARAAADVKNEKYADLKLDVNKIVDEELAKSDQFKKLRGQELSKETAMLGLQFNAEETRANNAAKNAATQADKIATDQPEKADRVNQTKKLAQGAADQATEVRQNAKQRQTKIQQLLRNGKLEEAQNEFSELQKELAKVKQAADNAETYVKNLKNIQTTKAEQLAAQELAATEKIKSLVKTLESKNLTERQKSRTLEVLDLELAKLKELNPEEYGKYKVTILTKEIDDQDARLEQLVKQMQTTQEPGELGKLQQELGAVMKNRKDQYEALKKELSELEKINPEEQERYKNILSAADPEKRLFVNQDGSVSVYRNEKFVTLTQEDALKQGLIDKDTPRGQLYKSPEDAKKAAAPIEIPKAPTPEKPSVKKPIRPESEIFEPMLVSTTEEKTENNARSIIAQSRDDYIDVALKAADDYAKKEGKKATKEGMEAAARKAIQETVQNDVKQAANAIMGKGLQEGTITQQEFDQIIATVNKNLNDNPPAQVRNALNVAVQPRIVTQKDADKVATALSKKAADEAVKKLPDASRTKEVQEQAVKASKEAAEKAYKRAAQQKASELTEGFKKPITKNITQQARAAGEEAATNAAKEAANQLVQESEKIRNLQKNEIYISEEGTVWRKEDGQIKKYNFDDAVKEQVVHKDTPKGRKYTDAVEARIKGAEEQRKKKLPVSPEQAVARVLENAEDKKGYVQKIQTQAQEIITKNKKEIENAALDAVNRYVQEVGDKATPDGIEKAAREAVNEKLAEFTRQAADDIAQRAVDQGVIPNGGAQAFAKQLETEATQELKNAPGRFVDTTIEKVVKDNLKPDQQIKRLEQQLNRALEEFNKANKKLKGAQNEYDKIDQSKLSQLSEQEYKQKFGKLSILEQDMFSAEEQLRIAEAKLSDLVEEAQKLKQIQQDKPGQQAAEKLAQKALEDYKNAVAQEIEKTVTPEQEPTKPTAEELRKSEEFKKLRTQELRTETQNTKLEINTAQKRANDAAKKAATQADEIANKEPGIADRVNRAKNIAQKAAEEAQKIEKDAAKNKFRIQQYLKEGNIDEAQKELDELKKNLTKATDVAERAEAYVQEIETIQQTPVEELLKEQEQAKTAQQITKEYQQAQEEVQKAQTKLEEAKTKRDRAFFWNRGALQQEVEKLEKEVEQKEEIEQQKREKLKAALEKKAAADEAAKKIEAAEKPVTPAPEPKAPAEAPKSPALQAAEKEVADAQKAVDQAQGAQSDADIKARKTLTQADIQKNREARQSLIQTQEKLRQAEENLLKVQQEEAAVKPTPAVETRPRAQATITGRQATTEALETIDAEYNKLDLEKVTQEQIDQFDKRANDAIQEKLGRKPDKALQAKIDEKLKVKKDILRVKKLVNELEQARIDTTEVKIIGGLQLEQKKAKKLQANLIQLDNQQDQLEKAPANQRKQLQQKIDATKADIEKVKNELDGLSTDKVVKRVKEQAAKELSAEAQKEVQEAAQRAAKEQEAARKAAEAQKKAEQEAREKATKEKLEPVVQAREKAQRLLTKTKLSKIADDAIKNIDENVLKEVAQNAITKLEKSGQIVTDDLMKEVSQKAIQEYIEKTAREATIKAAQEGVDNGTIKLSKEAAQEVAQETSNEQTQKYLKNTKVTRNIEGAIKERNQRVVVKNQTNIAVQKTVQNIDDKALQKAAQEAMQKEMDKALKEGKSLTDNEYRIAAKDGIIKLVKQQAQDATQKAAQEANEKATVKLTQEAIDQIAQEAAQREISNFKIEAAVDKQIIKDLIQKNKEAFTKQILETKAPRPTQASPVVTGAVKETKPLTQEEKDAQRIAKENEEKLEKLQAEVDKTKQAADQAKAEADQAKKQLDEAKLKDQPKLEKAYKQKEDLYVKKSNEYQRALVALQTEEKRQGKLKPTQAPPVVTGTEEKPAAKPTEAPKTQSQLDAEVAAIDLAARKEAEEAGDKAANQAALDTLNKELDEAKLKSQVEAVVQEDAVKFVSDEDEMRKVLTDAAGIEKVGQNLDQDVDTIIRRETAADNAPKAIDDVASVQATATEQMEKALDQVTDADLEKQAAKNFGNTLKTESKKIGSEIVDKFKEKTGIAMAEAAAKAARDAYVEAYEKATTNAARQQLRKAFQEAGSEIAEEELKNMSMEAIENKLKELGKEGVEKGAGYTVKKIASTQKNVITKTATSIPQKFASASSVKAVKWAFTKATPVILKTIESEISQIASDFVTKGFTGGIKSAIQSPLRATRQIIGKLVSEQAVKAAAERVGKKLGTMLGRKVATQVVEKAAPLVAKILAKVGMRVGAKILSELIAQGGKLGVEAAILSAGAAGAPFSFGVSLAISIGVDIVIEAVMAIPDIVMMAVTAAEQADGLCYSHTHILLQNRVGGDPNFLVTFRIYADAFPEKVEYNYVKTNDQSLINRLKVIKNIKEAEEELAKKNLKLAQKSNVILVRRASKKEGVSDHFYRVQKDARGKFIEIPNLRTDEEAKFIWSDKFFEAGKPKTVNEVVAIFKDPDGNTVEVGQRGDWGIKIGGLNKGHRAHEIKLKDSFLDNENRKCYILDADVRKCKINPVWPKGG